MFFSFVEMPYNSAESLKITIDFLSLLLQYFSFSPSYIASCFKVFADLSAYKALNLPTCTAYPIFNVDSSGRSALTNLATRTSVTNCLDAKHLPSILKLRVCYCICIYVNV